MKPGAHSPLRRFLTTLVIAGALTLAARHLPAVEGPSSEQAIAGNERRIEAVRTSNLDPLDKAALIALLRARIADLRSGVATPLLVEPTEDTSASAPVAPVATTTPATPPTALPGRRLTINGGAANVPVLLALEAQYGTRLPDGHYWYDAISGACGPWGGPTAGFLPPGLPLAGPLPADASGGGTGVVLNNRELHPTDVANLNQVLLLVNSRLPPGRWTLDRHGNLGLEGGAPAVNLMQILSAARANGSSQGGGAAGGAAGGNNGGGGNYWSSRYASGNEDANGNGYVYIPGTGGVMYGP